MTEKNITSGDCVIDVFRPVMIVIIIDFVSHDCGEEPKWSVITAMKKCQFP